MEHPQEPSVPASSPDDLEAMDRRAALLQLGRYASYVAPEIGRASCRERV